MLRVVVMQLIGQARPPARRRSGTLTGALLLRKYPEIQAGLTLGASASAGFAVRRSDPQLLATLNDDLDNLCEGPRGAAWWSSTSASRP